MEGLPIDLCTHHRTESDPLLLGYECHKVLAERLGAYDYYCYLEDDVGVDDPLFFWKIGWFSRQAGPHALLQPNRYELSASALPYKMYIDGPLVDDSISPRFQDRNNRPFLKAEIFGQELVFGRVDNPHSGCFFLTSTQMQRWTEQPYFLDRSAEFWGPLESAATLGIMRTFDVYKPTPRNAGFLEVCHLDPRYLRRQLSPIA